MQILSAPYLLDKKAKLKENQAIVIDQGIIMEVGSAPDLVQKYPQAERKDFTGCILLPGLVNAHTQLELLSLEPTTPRPNEAAPMTSWLLRSWEHRKHITPVERRSHLKEGIQKLLECGTTCVGDVGNYVGAVGSLPKDSLRMVLYAELFTSAEPSVQTDYEALMTIVDEIAALDTPHLRPGIFPYSAYTVSSSLLKIFSQNAKRSHTSLKIHAAESFAEMQFFFESTGEFADVLFPKLGWDQLPPAHRKTPIQFLDSIGFLNSQPALVGCSQLADGDIQTIARRGAKVIFTPRHQAALQLGVPPLKKLRKAGIPVGLGTNGGSVSLWDEMRFVLAREKEAESLWQMATLEGAEVLGLANEIGSLETGKRADVIVVKFPKKTGPDPLTTLIQETNERQIEAVFIDGKEAKIH